MCIRALERENYKEKEEWLPWTGEGCVSRTQGATFLFPKLGGHDKDVGLLNSLPYIRYISRAFLCLRYPEHKLKFFKNPLLQENSHNA